MGKFGVKRTMANRSNGLTGKTSNIGQVCKTDRTNKTAKNGYD